MRLWELITLRTQWCRLCDAILHLVTINNDDDNATPGLDYTEHYPFTISNIPIPMDRDGYVYVLVSVRDTQEIYIGSTVELAVRFKSHNDGKGSTSTNDYLLRPWALAGYICGFPRDQNVLETYEAMFKQFVQSKKDQGINDAFIWVNQGAEVAAAYNRNRTGEDNRVHWVRTIMQGSLINE